MRPQLSKFGGRHFQRTPRYCRSEKKGVSINLEQSAARTRGSSENEEPHEEPELGIGTPVQPPRLCLSSAAATFAGKWNLTSLRAYSLAHAPC